MLTFTIMLSKLNIRELNTKLEGIIAAISGLYVGLRWQEGEKDKCFTDFFLFKAEVIKDPLFNRAQ